MPKEERHFTQCQSDLSCSLCPSRGKTAGSGPFLGLVALYFSLFQKVKSQDIDGVEWFRVYTLSLSCDLAVYLYVCFVGDGRRRGAGLYHAAERVLRRSFEFIGHHTSRESKNQ